MPRRRYKQIIIRYIFFPRKSIDEEKFLEMLYASLGFGDQNDEIGKKVFKALVFAGERGVSSRELMENIDATQSAIIYHLNNLIRSGFAVKEGRNYYMRGNTLEETLEVLEEEVMEKLEKLKRMARMLNL